MQFTTVAIEKAKKSKKKISRLGIIDLGTNSLRFDVYTFKGKKVSRIHREKKMVRLGDQVFNTGLIPDDWFNRCLSAFSVFNK